MQSGKQKSSLQPVVLPANIEKVGSEIVTLSVYPKCFSLLLSSLLISLHFIKSINIFIRPYLLCSFFFFTLFSHLPHSFKIYILKYRTPSLKLCCNVRPTARMLLRDRVKTHWFRWALAGSSHLVLRCQGEECFEGKGNWGRFGEKTWLYTGFWESKLNSGTPQEAVQQKH